MQTQMREFKEPQLQPKHGAVIHIFALGNVETPKHIWIEISRVRWLGESQNSICCNQSMFISQFVYQNKTKWHKCAKNEG